MKKSSMIEERSLNIMPLSKQLDNNGTFLMTA